MSNYRQIDLTVDAGSGKIIDAADGTVLRNDDLPRIFYAEKAVICLSFVDSDSEAFALNADDLFELSIDNNFTHDDVSGELTAAHSGAVTEITVDGLDSDPAYSYGYLLLTNSSGESERVEFTSCSEDAGVYTFSVDATLSYSYAEDDSCVVEDPLMAYSGNEQVDIANDWSSISRAAGKISIRVDTLTTGFRDKLTAYTGSDEMKCHIEIKRYISGSSVPSVVLRHSIYAMNVVQTNEGTPVAANPSYYNQTQTDALLEGKADLLGSDDIEITDSDKGLILQDAAGTRYRLRVVTSEGISHIQLDEVS